MKRSLGILPDHIVPPQPLRTSSSSATSGTHSDCDSRDYHRLEHALKRVKISASPGQLRLENDLQSLLLHHAWTELNDEAAMDSECSSIYNHNFSSTSTNFKNLVSSTRLQQLGRDATDPLRLTLTLYMPSTTICNDIICNVKWIYHIQIPRMYPHSPPMIHRIIKSVSDDKGQELYRLTSDLTHDTFSEYWNSTQTDFYDLHGNRVSVEVAHRAQCPCVTLWVSQAWDPPSVEYLEREKAFMLTAILISSHGSHPDSNKNILSKRMAMEESRDLDLDKKVSCMLYHKTPYHNMAAFQDWSPIMQLLDLIALLLKISREWEQVIQTSTDLIPGSL